MDALRENEYLDEKDGLIHCSICHEPLQVRSVCEAINRDRIVRCVCKCKNPNADFRDRQKQQERERQRKNCFKEAEMFDWNFKNDDRSNEKMSDVMQNYVNDFTDHKQNKQGLLLYGEVGTGKTYHAACVANALIDKDFKVIFRTFREIERELWDSNKQTYMNWLNNCSLLILDDLGVERSSEYMQEIVFDVIDTRYKKGLPLMITTNLSIEEIKKPEELGRKRIYDRILERCFPIEVSGASRRRQKVKETFFDTKEKLGL